MNPILKPNLHSSWESQAVFNPTPLVFEGETFILFRAQGDEVEQSGIKFRPSTIGLAKPNSTGVYQTIKQLITPSESWDMFGCEDARVTKIGDSYYIFYTAISAWPPGPDSIKVGLAITRDLQTISEKHLITPFNAKAMALFPDRVDNKYAVMLSVNTDRSPSDNIIAKFEKLEDLWNHDIWRKIYDNLGDYTINLLERDTDHSEIGAPPIKTPYGWLLIYSYITDYYEEPKRNFTIKAALLDTVDPKKIIAKVESPLLMPEEFYELHGVIPNVVFPSGAKLDGDLLSVFYGGADTTCCLATCSLSQLLQNMTKTQIVSFERSPHNPILKPIPDNFWESKAVFNPAAVEIDGTIYIAYRALSEDNTSTIGLAMSQNAETVAYRYTSPIYTPREDFEKKREGGAGCGCEDPRITRIGDTLYMLYTAYNGVDNPRVALTQISVADFIARKWENWKTPVLITQPGVDNKDACLFPEKIGGKYVLFHRVTPNICLDFVDSLEIFDGNYFLKEAYKITPNPNGWDCRKVGISAPPIKTPQGWFLLYHGIGCDDGFYRVGAMMLELHDPTQVIARTRHPILEPETDYEKLDGAPFVFPCGNIVREDTLFIYYGGADRFTAVAKAPFSKLVQNILADQKVKITEGEAKNFTQLQNWS